MYCIIISGIIIIGLCTYFVSLNGKGIKKIGVIIICLGTFLMYLNSNYESKKVSSEIIEKIQMTNAKIETLKKNPTTSISKINQIDSEFNSWASDFIKNKDSFKLKLEKEKLDVENIKIIQSQKWFPVYDYFFTTLKNMIYAYNKSSSSKLLLKIPTVPVNLFSKEAHEFIAKIKFSKNLIWMISLQGNISESDTTLPEIDINIEEANLFDKNLIPNQHLYLFGDLTIYLDTEYSKIRLKHYNRFDTKELKNKYDLKNFKKSINQILETIIQYQLLNL